MSQKFRMKNLALVWGMAVIVTRFGWCYTLRNLIIILKSSKCTSSLQKIVLVTSCTKYFAGMKKL